MSGSLTNHADGTGIGILSNLDLNDVPTQEQVEKQNAELIEQATDRAKKHRETGYHKPLVFSWPDNLPQMPRYDEDGNVVGYSTGLIPRHLLEQTRFDESVPRITPYAWQLNHPVWPFGTYPQIENEHAWEAIVAGYYCMRCLNRLPERDAEECLACGLDRAEREYAWKRIHALQDMDRERAVMSACDELSSVRQDHSALPHHLRPKMVVEDEVASKRSLPVDRTAGEVQEPATNTNEGES